MKSQDWKKAERVVGAYLNGEKLPKGKLLYEQWYAWLSDEEISTVRTDPATADRIWLVLNEVRTIDAALPERNIVQAIYTQIIADLTSAEGLSVTYPAQEAGRATRGAAKTRLAKVHLTRRNWAQAATKAKEASTSICIGYSPTTPTCLW